MKTTKPDANDFAADTQALSFVVLGEPASKSNSRRLVRRGGRSMVIKSQKALDYSEEFRKQVRPGQLLEGDLAVTMRIHYASRRPDLDESLILDLLQGVAYKNDRQVREKHIFWGLDRENPRCEILVQKKQKDSQGVPLPAFADRSEANQNG